MKSSQLEGQERACRCLQGLAHPVRLQILERLRRGPASVNTIGEGIEGISQSGLSQHLAKMRSCSLLICKRSGAQIFYEIADNKVLRFVDLLLELVSEKGRKRT